MNHSLKRQAIDTMIQVPNVIAFRRSALSDVGDIEHAPRLTTHGNRRAPF